MSAKLQQTASSATGYQHDSMQQDCSRLTCLTARSLTTRPEGCSTTKGERPFISVPVTGQQKSASFLGCVPMEPAATAVDGCAARCVGVSLRSIRCLRLVMCDSDLGIAYACMPQDSFSDCKPAGGDGVKVIALANAASFALITQAAAV